MVRKRTTLDHESRRLAFGLSYDQRSGGAPALSVKGSDLQADQIIKIARRFGIPVVEKPIIAGALKTIDLDSEIPESLYQPVAILLTELDRDRSRS